jgi:hypothetical protein
MSGHPQQLHTVLHLHMTASKNPLDLRRRKDRVLKRQVDSTVDYTRHRCNIFLSRLLLASSLLRTVLRSFGCGPSLGTRYPSRCVATIHIIPRQTSMTRPRCYLVVFICRMQSHPHNVNVVALSAVVCTYADPSGMHNSFAIGVLRKDLSTAPAQYPFTARSRWA